jgi:hypothetical protein
MLQALVCFARGLMRTRKFGCIGVDSKFVQPQFEVDQDLGIWEFDARPFLARRIEKNAARKKNTLGIWYLKIIGI